MTEREKHRNLWEVQPYDPITGIRLVTPVRDEKRTHGIIVFLFENEADAVADAVAYAERRLGPSRIEQRPWAKSIFTRCVKSGSALLPKPFEFE